MAADPAEWQEAKSKTDNEPQGSDVAEQQAGPPEDLKVVVSIREGRATIGVQRPSSDPHIESFDEPDPSELVREVSAVIERARARWEEAPKYPAHARPASPARRRRDRAGGCHQDGRMYRGFLHFGLEPGEAPRDRTGWKCAPWFGSVLGPQWRSNPLVSISWAFSGRHVPCSGNGASAPSQRHCRCSSGRSVPRKCERRSWSALDADLCKTGAATV